MFKKLRFPINLGNCKKLFSTNLQPDKLTKAAVDVSYNGPDYEKIVSMRKKFLSPATLAFYRKPLLIHRGEMQYLYDYRGTRYLDMLGGVVTVSVGHCHPKVNAALEEQMKTLWHTTNIYMHPKIHEYAEKLVNKLPGDLNVVYLVNSGSEANDLAMLLARLYTGNFDIITLNNAYHGASPYTMGLTSQSPWKHSVPGLNLGILNAMNADPYIGIWGGKYCRDSPIQTSRNCNCSPDKCEASDNYLQQLNELFKYNLPKGKCAAMFAESIQGAGGSVQFPKGYIKRACEMVRSHGGIFISDEVQTGFGRTGDNYWGFEGHGIIPDIVTMAKGIGNGFPLGAVVTTPEIAQSLTKALHFNTFGGNPLASAVGISVLDVIDEEKLQENSLNVGTYLLKGLEELRKKYNVIGDVRGKGLMIGIEMVKDPETKKPLDHESFVDIWEHCKDMGVLLGKGGVNGNVFRIKPPMCVTKEDADFALDVLEGAIKYYLEN